jgi:hypothetical protein
MILNHLKNSPQSIHSIVFLRKLLRNKHLQFVLRKLTTYNRQPATDNRQLTQIGRERQESGGSYPTNASIELHHNQVKLRKCQFYLLFP